MVATSAMCKRKDVNHPLLSPCLFFPVPRKWISWVDFEWCTRTQRQLKRAEQLILMGQEACEIHSFDLKTNSVLDVLGIDL